VQILNVVEVILDRLANDVGSAAVELLGGSIQLSAKGVGEAGRDLDHGKPRRITVMSVTFSLGCSRTACSDQELLVSGRQPQNPRLPVAGCASDGYASPQTAARFPGIPAP